MSQTPLCDALRALARTCADIPPKPAHPLYQRMKLEVPQEVFDRLGAEVMLSQQWRSLHSVSPTIAITVGWIEVTPLK